MNHKDSRSSTLTAGTSSLSTAKQNRRSRESDFARHKGGWSPVQPEPNDNKCAEVPLLSQSDAKVKIEDDDSMVLSSTPSIDSDSRFSKATESIPGIKRQKNTLVQTGDSSSINQQLHREKEKVPQIPRQAAPRSAADSTHEPDAPIKDEQQFDIQRDRTEAQRHSQGSTYARRGGFRSFSENASADQLDSLDRNSRDDSPCPTI